MALKDLVASKATLAEGVIEAIVSEFVRYDVDEREVALTAAGAALPVRAKILVYLVALQGWPLLVKDAIPTDATPTDIGEHLGMAGGSVRPTLTDLRDRHVVTAKKGRYSVRASSLPAIKEELSAGGKKSRPTGRSKSRSKTREANGRSSAKRGGSSAKSGTLAARFDGWIEAGFFDEPRTSTDVRKKFRQAGVVVPITTIPQYLLKAVRANRLSREEAEVAGKNVWVYQRTQ
jgi:hypothetical protein